MAATRIARALTEEGIHVLRFDFTGLGHSEGEFSSSHFSANKEDLRSAAEYLSTHYKAPALMIGHSLGGAAVISVARELSSVKGVVTIGSPAQVDHVLENFKGDLPQIALKGRGEVELGGRRFPIDQSFVEDLQNQNQERAIATLKKPLLIFHSPEDAIVPIDHARLIYETAHHPKSFISLDKADHLLSKKEDAQYVAKTLAAWAERYVGAPLPSSGSEGKVTIEGQKGHLVQQITIGAHDLLADEPKGQGGEDLGPTPYELLLASLGSCTAMTLLMYAKRKGWPLEAVSIALHSKRLHRRDCEDCEGDRGFIDILVRDIEVSGPLDPAQVERLKEIADRCPVHRTITQGPKITSKFHIASLT